VNTPEMGIHGVIEFGNRLLTIVLLAISIAVVVVLWRMRRERRDLWWIAMVLLAGVPIQAVIGGISVWTQLNPYVVGLHFIVTVIMTALSMIVVLRVRDVDVIAPIRAVPPLSWAIGFMTFVVITFGVITTGSGPHAGDANAPRTGLDPAVIQHFHAWPAYVTVALVVLAILRASGAVRRSWLVVLAVFGVQITVGIAQARLGLPVPLVAVHVLLAMVITAVTTTAVYRSAMNGSIATAMKRAVK
jgi:cytochrome c oxidase assembly protein subunit 15